MKPIIYIMAGVSGSGKDEFINIIRGIVGKDRVKCHSSVQFIKDWFISMNIGPKSWENKRPSEAERKAISDIKIALHKLDDLPNRILAEKYVHADPMDFLFAHIREQEHIDSFKKIIGDNAIVQVVLVRRVSAEENIPDNEGDQTTLLVDPDLVIYNDGTLEDLHNYAVNFLGDHYHLRALP